MSVVPNLWREKINSSTHLKFPRSPPDRDRTTQWSMHPCATCRSAALLSSAAPRLAPCRGRTTPAWRFSTCRRSFRPRHDYGSVTGFATCSVTARARATYSCQSASRYCSVPRSRTSIARSAATYGLPWMYEYACGAHVGFALRQTRILLVTTAHARRHPPPPRPPTGSARPRGQARRRSRPRETRAGSRRHLRAAVRGTIRGVERAPGRTNKKSRRPRLLNPSQAAGLALRQSRGASGSAVLE